MLAFVVGASGNPHPDLFDLIHPRRPTPGETGLCLVPFVAV